MRSGKLADLLTIDDMRAQARRTLPRMLFDFVDGAAGDEATAFRNSAPYQTHALIGSALTGSSVRDQSRMLFGQTIRSPVMVAQTGSSGLLWPRGEAEVARACAAAGTIMSAGATLSIEEVGNEMVADIHLPGSRHHEGLCRGRQSRRLRSPGLDDRLSGAGAAGTGSAQWV